ncbi:exodeoxyribonuclease III [Saccharobesus litoralis]|uniref:Exodeoxyribonuclease III n=1 Tax=Saccharobesus litoralis TaxID=2172099 RepID=A0A2S0VU42_9ALTE|nr:exodeoxyribonuclease III [Saccharobesus litoralis]AWB67744.1 exodeoxyribonuclease III [Saccharobesus litoralis]
MKIISFNINGLRARIHQLKAILDKHQPDVIGLQEIKVHDEAFPLEDVQALGYHVEYFGQKAHYGVAMLSKKAPLSIQKGFKTDGEDMQRRMIIGTYDDGNGGQVTVFNGYFPQGENINHETKFPYKRQFYQDLMTELNEHYTPEQQIVVMGDFNISPTDLDIGIGDNNAKRWLKTGKCSFQPEEREWFGKLLDWGFIDTFRVINPEEKQRYSWFDYRSKGFDDNRGLRIDTLLATKSLADKTVESDVDYELRGIEKPSDHAPVWSTFNIG